MAVVEVVDPFLRLYFSLVREALGKTLYNIHFRRLWAMKSTTWDVEGTVYKGLQHSLTLRHQIRHLRTQVRSNIRARL